jgi:hypothetical protein
LLRNRYVLTAHLIVGFPPPPPFGAIFPLVDNLSTAWLASKLPNEKVRCCADGSRLGEPCFQEKNDECDRTEGV